MIDQFEVAMLIAFAAGYFVAALQIYIMDHLQNRTRGPMYCKRHGGHGFTQGCPDCSEERKS